MVRAGRRESLRLPSAPWPSRAVKAVTEAVAHWPAVQLEGAVFDAHGCAAAVCTAEQAHGHPRAKLVNAMPPLEFEQLG